MEKIVTIFAIYLIMIQLNLVQNTGNKGSHIKVNSLHYNSEVEDDFTSSKIQTAGRKRVRRKSNELNPNKMYYPDEFHKLSARNCSFGLCEQVDNYPTQRIERIISRSLDIQKYFADQPPNVDISTRFGDEGENLCSTRVHTIFPKSATNIHGVEQLLVNVGDFKQGVNFETCSDDGKPCKFSETFPDGYSTTCLQKYTVRRLMALGKESEPVFDNFQLPSCCVCTFKKN